MNVDDMHTTRFVNSHIFFISHFVGIQKASKLDSPTLEIEDHSDDDFQKTLEDLDKKNSKSTKVSD